LGPGFTNTGVARVSEAVGEGISINVARGDGPSNAIAHKIMSEVGVFDYKRIRRKGNNRGQATCSELN
jgi:hypothetical protein